MQIKWAALAFVRLTLCYISGILLYQRYNGLQNQVLFTLFGSVLAYSFLLFFSNKITKRKFSGVFSALAFTIVVSAAYTNIAYQNENNKLLFKNALESDIQAYTALIEKPPIEKANGYNVILSVQQIKQNNNWKHIKGKVNAYLPFKGNLPNLNDKLLIKGRPLAYNPPLNPGEFDFRKLMNRKGIYLQHYLTQDKIRFLGKAENNFFTYAYSFRAYFMEHFKKYITGKNELAIALALVIGVKEQLDHDIKNAYSGAGAMHVLAVSGLHVGIIFNILGWLFFSFKKQKYGRWFYGIATGIVLWFYAAITGFSPSVVRASTMFTFVLIALIINRKSSIYNTLAASALCMLIYNPNFLFQVGFQLSYVAVFGIVFLYPKIYGIFEVRNYWLDQLWKISVVSIAAQIATFPLGLFYFHQFPVYFLLANPFVIIAATLVVTIGILFPITGFMPTIIPTLVGKLINIILYLSNQIVFLINQLPFARTEPIHFNTLEVLFVYGIIIILLLFFTFKRLKYLSVAVFSTLLFSAFSIYGQTKTNNQLMTVYAIKKHSCISIVYDDKAYVLADSVLSKDHKKIAFHIGNHLLEQGINNYNILPFSQLDSLPFPTVSKENNYFLVINEQKIGILTNNNTYLPANELDIAICTKNAFTFLEKLRSIQSKKIVFDSSNTSYFVEKIKEELKSISVHNTTKQAAVSFNLSTSKVSVNNHMLSY